MTSALQVLRLQSEQLKQALAQVGEMRPGSLAERYRKCGKTSCHCAARGSAGHGPLYSLTHPVGGKTVTHVIPKGSAVERTRQQIAEYRRFRELVRQLVEVSEHLCDLELKQEPMAPEQDNKKNRARRTVGQRGRTRH